MPVTPSNTTSHAIIADSTFPPMKTFGAPRPPRPIKSNNDLALDFIELSFRLESGRDLPVFTRFEEPITVRVTGSTPQSLGSDLTKIAAPIADRSEYHHQSYFRKRASKYDDSSGKPRKNSTHIATCCMFCCS
jgi:hypothetical protein|tara:strand:+ start:15180 stop:15578 length:399 start_codon:yes stop_codon:yes gene_type:complete